MDRMPIKDLHLWDKNPRTIKDKRFHALCKSMTDDPSFLELRPVLATKDGRIYAGNMRYRAAKHLGWKDIPAIITDIPEKLARERAIKDNNEYGEWNNDELATLLDEMEKEGTDLSLLGLDDSIQKIIDQLNEKEIVEDEVPAVKKDPNTKLGDLWQLGEHRLLCGDATKSEDVERLMDGQKADMVYCDPPYGMFLDADFSGMVNDLNFAKDKGFKGGRKYDNVIGDHSDFNPEFINSIFAFLPCKEVFLWGANYYSELLPSRNDGSWIVWDKRLEESADKMYGSCFELCWSKAKHKQDIARVKWAGVFGTEKEFDHKRHHPTQKPVGLSCWFIERYSEAGNCISDLFGGSGSTLIACEQLKRKCYMMELDPQYVRVIIDRWEKLTGQKAKLL